MNTGIDKHIRFPLLVDGRIVREFHRIDGIVEKTVAYDLKGVYVGGLGGGLCFQVLKHGNHFVEIIVVVFVVSACGEDGK
jgi:hypothetical protein